MKGNNLYRENLLYLDRYWRTLGRRVRRCRHVDATVLDSGIARSGALSLKVTTAVGTYPLHSGYDPEKEARIKVECAGENKDGVVAMFGVGLGYHVVNLLSVSNARVIVVEPSVRVFAAFLANVRLSTVAGIDRCEFFIGTGDERMMTSVSQRIEAVSAPVRTIVLDGAVSAFPQEYARFAECVRTATERVRAVHGMFRNQLTVLKERYHCDAQVSIAFLCKAIMEHQKQYEELPLERVFVHYYYMAQLQKRNKR